jgi:hypothetical protein
LKKSPKPIDRVAASEVEAAPLRSRKPEALAGAGSGGDGSEAEEVDRKNGFE